MTLTKRPRIRCACWAIVIPWLGMVDFALLCTASTTGESAHLIARPHIAAQRLGNRIGASTIVEQMTRDGIDNRASERSISGKFTRDLGGDITRPEDSYRIITQTKPGRHIHHQQHLC